MLVNGVLPADLDADGTVTGTLSGTGSLSGALASTGEVAGRLTGTLSLSAEIVPISGVSYATEEDGIVTITGGVAYATEEDGIITITGLPWSDNNGVLELLTAIYYGTVTGRLATVMEIGG